MTDPTPVPSKKKKAKKPRTWVRWALVSQVTGQIARPTYFTKKAAEASALDAALAYGTRTEPIEVRVTEIIKPRKSRAV